MHQPGWQFLQIPGPTNVPEQVLRAMARPTIDHRGAEFARLVEETLDRLQPVFGTTGPVCVFPGSGTGGWEAALVNTLSPGDRILMVETGHFAVTWQKLASHLGLDVVLLPGDWRRGVRAEQIEAALREDAAKLIRAVAVVHNETSTGVTSSIKNVRAAMDRAAHPALLMVDTISSLASIPYQHDAWGVDVTIAASQKGLMLPPGLAFNAMSDKALAANTQAGLPRSYWDWQAQLAANKSGLFPYTPATNLLFGLREALAMLSAEGLESVYARHARLGQATRAAVIHWGLEFVCLEPGEFSNTLTAVLMPEGHDADAFRARVLTEFNLALGNGLGKLSGRAFRIGHLGAFNDLMLLGTLSGVEMGLARSQIPHQAGGVQAALDYLSTNQ
ncbi:MAG: serine--glyoxylate aminotransferase [Gammaproteobacteria bacterium]|nr:MAG: serine--glyoxylate aminotransferase [Gammaproteobacteria bacterium]